MGAQNINDVYYADLLPTKEYFYNQRCL